MSQDAMKDAAALLRKGGKLLSIVCPDCGSPLIQLKTGEVYCPREKKEVRLEGEAGEEGSAIEAELEKTLNQKLFLMKEQVEFSGGGYEIESSKGAGTRIQASWPIVFSPF